MCTRDHCPCYTPSWGTLLPLYTCTEVISVYTLIFGTCALQTTYLQCISSFFFRVPSYIFWVHHFWWGFCMWHFFKSNQWGSHILYFGWCMLVCFCCQNPAVKDMNVRIFWVCAMECMCAYYTSFYTHIRKSFFGMESEPMLPPRRKSPLPETQRRIEPATLHHAGHAQHTTHWAIPPRRPPPMYISTCGSPSPHLLYSPLSKFVL